MRPAQAVAAALLAGVLALAGVADRAAAEAGAAAGIGGDGVFRINDEWWAAMQGRSWRDGLGCPPREQLRLVMAPYRDFEGKPQIGLLILHADVAAEVRSAFIEIFETSDFRIHSMRPVLEFAGDDNRSMAANNTSAFNCRTIAGASVLSEHGRGRALDINPMQNPYVSRSGRVSPPTGAAYATPAARRPGALGVITPGDAVTRAFARIGWGWGGDWAGSKDFQHFSATGR